MRTSTRMTLAAGAAVALGAAPLGAVFEEWRWIFYAWAAVAAVVGAQLLARSLRLPALLVPVAGAAGLLVYLTVVFAADAALLGLIPTRGSVELLLAGLDRGMTNVNQLAAPVPTTTGLLLLTSASIGAVAIVVDLIAVGLRRPAASGLALLALYAVPTAVAINGVPWVLFAIGATGYLLLLLVEGRDRLLHWGRPVGAAGTGEPGDADAPLPLTGQRIGAAAIAVAVVVPLLVPGLTGNALSRIARTGTGSGTGTGGALNDFASLRGELRRPAPLELMRVTTSEERPPYLRAKVLDIYNPGGFSSAGDDFTEDVRQRLLTPNEQPRLAQQERTFTNRIELTSNYRDDHLPLYYWPSQLTGLGNSWRYDDDKAVVGREEGLDDGLKYTVTSVAPEPTVEQLAVIGELPNDVREALPNQVSLVPEAVRKSIESTVDSIVNGISSPYLKAKAINDYFTDGSRGFTYAVTTNGNGRNQLLDFLKNKRGYCEQYAAAMAIMLRVADIPSRVVIGYTPGRRQDDGTYLVTTSDAHAWVEAYFAGVGWTYFDPTPLADGRTVAPAYAPRPAPSATPTGSASAGAIPSVGPTANQLPEEDLNPGIASPTSPGEGVLTPRRALVTGGLLAALLLLLMPALARLAARRRRLRTAAGADAQAAARAAWDEVLGSATDYGVPTPRTETPRGLARRLGRDLSLDAEATRGLRLVALAEERARYAARAGVDGDLPEAVRAVRRGLRADAERRRRWRAVLLPPSTVGAARTGSARRAADASSALSRLGEAVRRPVTPRRR